MDQLSTIVITIICCCIAFIIYFIPSIVAFKTKHIEKKTILVINLFLGFTFIGWIVSLLWALSDSKSYYARKLEEAHRMGVISDHEFQEKIKQLYKK